MRQGYTTLAVVGVSACIAVYALSFQPEKNSVSLFANGTLGADDMEYMKFISQYGRMYGTKEELEFRSNIFKKNLAAIRLENSRNGNGFTLGVNKFADWTPQEYKRLLGYKPSRGLKQYSTYHAVEGIALPTSVDWRQEGAVNPVKDQGQCGSCWTFSAVGSIESRFKISGGDLLQLSEQQLVDCCKYLGSDGCNGGDEDSALDYARDFGMMNETEYVYTAQTQNCSYNETLITPARPKNRTNVIKNNATDLMAAVATGPVSVALEADTLVFQFYTGGILNSQACGLELDHAVVVVGYGADPVYGGYYIVRNSWGPLWGVNGYINIAIQDGPGICGIQQDASYPTF